MADMGTAASKTPSNTNALLPSSASSSPSPAVKFLFPVRVPVTCHQTSKQKRCSRCCHCKLIPMGHSGFTCIRFTLCTCNVLAWLAGCGILGVGIWLNLAYGGYATILPAYSSLSADSLCIIAGVVTFAISFFGCCGSWFRNRCLLLMYFTLVTLTFSLEVTVGTLAFVYRESLTDTLRKQFTVGIQKNYQQPGEQGFTVTWDHIQTELKCCGVVESSDWYKIDAWPKEDRVPDSCCHNSTYEHDCGKNLKNIYEKGCFEKIRVWVIEQLHVVGIIVLVFAFIQLFGLVASMLIYCTLRRQSRKMDY